MGEARGVPEPGAWQGFDTTEKSNEEGRPRSMQASNFQPAEAVMSYSPSYYSSVRNIMTEISSNCK